MSGGGDVGKVGFVKSSCVFGFWFVKVLEFQFGVCNFVRKQANNCLLDF